MTTYYIAGVIFCLNVLCSENDNDKLYLDHIGMQEVEKRFEP